MSIEDDYASRSTQSAIKIQHAVICVLIGCEENSTIGNLRRISDPMQRNLLEIFAL